MTRPIHVDINCTTGEQTIIELSDEQIAEREIEIAKAETYRLQLEAEKQALADLKASAKAKLVAGEPLTEEEAALIIL